MGKERFIARATGRGRRARIGAAALLALPGGAAAGRRALESVRRRADERADDRHDACLATVRMLAASVEARDACTGGHLERVCRLGMLVARTVAREEARDPQMAFGFMLHDLGKLSTPDRVLHKPGRLDAEEREVMRRHPEEGARILASVPFLARARDVVLHHHERWDGDGYPARLAGEAIPLWARIFSVADALDAMTSERPYGRRFTLDEALDEIAAGAGSQFDPAVVLGLMRLPRWEVEALLEPAGVARRRGRVVGAGGALAAELLPT
jgi:HD-GYP domain-containing protein (c-di-GMP phosphodiesterase class II)